MRVMWLHEIPADQDLREVMRGLRWLMIRGQDLNEATAAWMFAELDGCLIAVDHRHAPFENDVHNRAIHLLLVNQGANEVRGITKVIESETETLEQHLW